LPDSAARFKDKFLTVQLGGSPQSPDRILLIPRPRGGRVRVREWHADARDTGGTTRVVDTVSLLAEIVAASSASAALSPPLAEVRAWLEGGAADGA
jgi:hypothetical protein